MVCYAAVDTILLPTQGRGIDRAPTMPMCSPNAKASSMALGAEMKFTQEILHMKKQQLPADR